ncbi:MAG: amidohydrolase [Desulfobulbaceae bacterium]|nr:amidohydrolase [Desulfobulbaceae bacterium]HIJ79050.1 amidohydrolase [Deltaproteobacteria bacterium]
MTVAASADVNLVVCGLVYTRDKENSVIEDGAVAIAGDMIVEVGSREQVLGRYPRAQAIIEEHGLIMPGLVNTHTHAAMACFRGLADDLPLMTWLQHYIFPIEANLTAEIVYHSSLLSMAEMIKSGTTSFCDMYLFAKEVARATSDSGMRGWLGEVLYDFDSPNYGGLESGFNYVEEMFAQYEKHPLVTITVDPHSVYTCSPALLQRLKEVAERRNAPYVIHLSETKDEVAGCLKLHGNTPVKHLQALGLLDEQVIAAHGVVLTEEEIELLSVCRVKVAHCPESNMKLASGVAPIPQLLAAGVTVGLGTDGCASNNDVDMFGEMDTAAKLHKVNTLDPTVMSAETTLGLATRGGAELLGAEGEIGSIEPGKKADIIVLDLNQPHLTPMYHIPSHLVYAARGADVIHSIINGRLVMRNRRLLTIDEAAILATMNEIGRDIRKKLGKD